MFLVSNVNFDKHIIKELIADLIKNRGKCLVLVGSNQPDQIHVLVHAINSSLDNIGKTMYFSIILKMI